MGEGIMNNDQQALWEQNDDQHTKTTARVFRESPIFDKKRWWELTDEENEELWLGNWGFYLDGKTIAHQKIRAEYEFPVVIFSL